MIPEIYKSDGSMHSSQRRTESEFYDTLYEGEFLTAGQSLISANGRWMLAYQGDAHLVGYNIYPQLRYFWATWSYQVPPGMLIMQTDGDLVCYTNTGRAYWTSGTRGRGVRPYRLVIQSDRDIIIYDGSNTPIWRTSTNLPWEGCPESTSSGELRVLGMSPEVINRSWTCKQDSDCSYASCYCHGAYGVCCGYGGYCPAPECNTGFYKGAGGATWCTHCPVGSTLADRDGECKQCPLGHFARAGWIESSSYLR
jgi:hypothetical protein